MSLGMYFTRFASVRALVVALAICSAAQGQNQTASDPAPDMCSGMRSSSNGAYNVTYAVSGDNIIFTLQAMTTGWVGIGFSLDQFMPNSDVVVGASNAESSFVYDGFASAQSRPPADASQDITSTAAVVENGVTTVFFTRQRVTNDSNDVSLDQCVYFLYAWGGTADFNTQVIGYHGDNRESSDTMICLPSPSVCPAPLPEPGIMPVSPQNITLNPTEQIEMEVLSTIPFGVGRWSVVGGERIVQDNEVGRFIGRVSINTTQFTSKLVISPTNYGDSGVYEFEAVESDVSLPLVNFYISLPPRPAEIPYNRSLNVTAFTSLNLTCVGAFPNESLEWQLNGDTLIEAPFVNIQADTLTFIDTSPFRSGQYSCRSLDTGAVLSNYDITFSVGPVTLVPVSSQNITLSPPNATELEVSSSAPIGFGSWSVVGGERINQSSEVGRFVGRVSINTTEFTSKLVIFRTNYGDSGVYQFSDLEPLFGSAAINFSVSLPPRDIQIPHTENLTVSSNKPLNLSCLGALPNEQVSWQYQGFPLNDVSHVDVTSARTNVLWFTQTSPPVSGRYTCHSQDTGDILSDYHLAFVSACPADLLFPITNEGTSASIPCSQIHPSFNPFGVAIRTCPVTLSRRRRGIQVETTRMSDFSQCTFSSEANNHVVLVRVRQFLETPQGIYPLSVAEQQTSFHMSQLKSSLNSTLSFSVSDLQLVVPVFSLETIWSVEYVFRFTAPASVPIVELERNLSLLQSSSFFHIAQVSDACDCPNDFSTTLVVSPSVRAFCRAPSYVSAVCQCPLTDPLCVPQCLSPFTNLSSTLDGPLTTPPPNPQRRGINPPPLTSTMCTLDIDRDGIPDSQDDCIGCCPGNTFYGLTWPTTAQMATARVSCSLIHSSFAQTSFVERDCSAQRFSGSVDFRNCVFKPEAMTSLLLYTAILPDPPGAGINNATRSADAVRAQLSVVLSEDSVRLTDAVSVYETETGGYRATYHIEFLDPDTDVTAVEARLNIGPQSLQQDLTAGRRKRQAAQTTVQLQPDVTQSQGFIVSHNCSCSLTASDGNSSVFVDVCTGQGLSPCDCSGSICTCSDPYVTVSADGVATLVCESDLDGDGVSDSQDLCRTQYSPTNECLTPTVQALVGGCPAEVDAAWGFTWPATPAGLNATMRCEENPVSVTGLVSRFCMANGTWDVVDASGCRNQQIVDLQQQLNQIANQPLAVGVPLAPMEEEQLQILTDMLATTLAELSATGISTFPSDLETVNAFIEIITRLADENRLFEDGTYQPISLVTVVSNVLEPSNGPGWSQLVTMGSDMGSPQLLRNIESLSTQVARSLAMSNDTISVTTAANIVITAVALDRDLAGDFNFSSANFDEIGTNIARDNVPDVVIPGGLLSDIPDNLGLPSVLGDVRIPVAFTVTRNVDQFLPRRLDNGSEFVSDRTQPGTLTISVQVGTGDEILNSDALTSQPAMFTFPITAANQSTTVENQRCVFWEFLGNTSGTTSGWSSDNLTTNVTSNETVICFSTHLTSFAVLVDASGVTLPDEAALAFSILTYIGCAVSIVCLLLTIVFLLVCVRKEIFTKVNNFVLLNLSITLFVALIVFVCGIQTATWNVVACSFVAVLLHYLFLSVFSWMLCEAVVIYNLLVKVFGANKRMWIYIYSGLGWGIPIPIIIVSLGSRWSYYYIRGSTDSSSPLYHQIRACWLSTEVGMIYAFIVPMLCIIIVNTVLLCLSLYSLYKSNFGRSMQKIGEEEKQSRNTGIQLMKAFVILLPLMGITWIIGLFAVSAHPATYIFQIVFIVLNSLQGFFIFVFHVVRHDKVWSKITAAFGQMKDRSTTTGTGSKSTKSTNNRSPAVSHNTSQKPVELSAADDSELRKSPLPPATVMATAESQFEESSKENMMEMESHAVPAPEFAEGGAGSQHSLASIEDGPVVQEMGDETVRIQFTK